MANEAILNNIYNYYHTTYMPRTSSKYDAHKKDDLKNVYNSIRKIDKEAPVFLLDRSAEVEKYTIQMKESALKFRDDVANLGGLDEKTMFEQKAVFSSDDSVAEAKYINSDSPRDKVESVDLSIERVAQNQINKGFYLPMSDMELPPGSYSFDVSTNISSYELQLNIAETDTNYSVQTRLARLINNSNIGLNASVSFDDNASALILSSVSNGSYDGDQPFEISDEDTSQQNGLIDYFGIRNVTQNAGWAKYTVNGEEFESPSNQVEVNNTYAVNLKKASSESITLGTKPDVESLKENIKGLTGAYNSFVKSAAEYLEKYPRTTLLVNSMKRMTSGYQDQMSILGISQDEQGTLRVDEDVLEKKLTEGEIEGAVGALKSFTQTALRKVNQVQLNPMDYVDKRIVAYKNPNKSHFPNPYLTSAYSGMLFNSYM